LTRLGAAARGEERQERAAAAHDEVLPRFRQTRDEREFHATDERRNISL
jgi:hypothetical protein